MARLPAKTLDVEAPENSRVKLLRATEQRIIHRGAHSLTIRLIEADAGVNSSLIGYYFSGLGGLLAELLHTNLDLILTERARRLAEVVEAGQGGSADAILGAFLRSLWQEAAYSRGERALAVVHEIFGIAVDPLRREAADKMDASFRPLVDSLKRCLPQLDETTLFWRLCCLSGAMVEITPRAAAWEMYRDVHGDPRSLSDDAWFQQMKDFAVGALTAPSSPAAAQPRESAAARPARATRARRRHVSKDAQSLV